MAEHWSVAEFGSAKLGDTRRTDRLVRVAQALSRKPGQTLGAALDVAGAKAAYRLFNAPDVTPAAILAPHQAQTWARMAGEPVVLIAQDTTVLNYSTHEESEGFGGIGGGHTQNHGCFLHSALAFAADGVPLGVLRATQWSRATPQTEPESVRWGAVVRTIAADAPPDGPRLIHLADQEGNDWALLSACVETQSSFVIRCDGRRVVAPGQSVRACLATAPVLGVHDLAIAAKALRKGHGSGVWSPGNDRPASPARTARVTVRAQTLTIPRTRTRRDGVPQVTCTVVAILETQPPAGVKDPVEWFLMTDEPVHTLADADRVAAWYRQRWAIETWHRTLKSGIKVEECRLASYDRMQRFLVLAAILAWRIDWMTRIARAAPDAPPTPCWTRWNSRCCADPPAPDGARPSRCAMPSGRSRPWAALPAARTLGSRGARRCGPAGCR